MLAAVALSYGPSGTVPGLFKGAVSEDIARLGEDMGVLSDKLDRLLER